MTQDERALLLTVARVMRAQLKDALSPYLDQRADADGEDYADLCDALKPFDGSEAPPINEASVTPPAARKEEQG